MYLSIVLCGIVWLYFLFAGCNIKYTELAEDEQLYTGLIRGFRNKKKYNKGIKKKIDSGLPCSTDDLVTTGTILFYYFSFSILFSVIAIIIVVFISFAADILYSPQKEISETYNINCLQDNITSDSVKNGRIYMYTDGDLEYYYSITTNKGDKIEHISSDDVYIKYDNDKHPCITEYRKIEVLPEWYKKIFLYIEKDFGIVDYYVITVPEGTVSVTDNYDIDLQ